MAEIILNKGQELFKKEATAYINNEKHTEKEYITLSGPGGVGKTESLRQVLQGEAIKGKNIVGCALSNSASAILAKSIDYADVMTYSKAFKEMPVEDEDGNIQFKTVCMPNETPAYKADIFVMDECSMAGPDRVAKILEYTKKKAKIIFVGDMAQLSVIETGKISEVFDNTIVDLTEIMRAKPLLNEINSLFRREILAIINEGSMENPYILNEKLHFHDEVDGDVGYYKITNKEDFIKAYLTEYKRNQEDPLHAKIIAYTNRSINSYNTIIRDELFGKQRDLYLIDDILLTESPYMNDGIYLPTNTYFRVKSISYRKYNGVMCYVMSIETDTNIYDNIPVIDMDDYRSYKIKLSQLTGKAKRRLITWREVNAFKTSFMKVSYGYAISSHKVQGQTINSSFVCETEIKATTLPSDLNKLQSIYVATTRAKDTITLY